MARLLLSLLGTFDLSLDGRPVTAFEYNKVRALLAYLTVEADRPHRRERLAGLLWPNWPEREARHNLSQALFNLRSLLDDDQKESLFVIVTSQTLQFNRSSDYRLDVTEFMALLANDRDHRHHRSEICEQCLERRQQAVELYRGHFLIGFSLNGSQAFEEWQMFHRERLYCLVMEALSYLVHGYEQRGQYEPAVRYGRQWVALDPGQEEAQRQLMRVLALTGQRGAAMVQYQTCRRLLAGWGIEPAEETVRLYEQIRAGRPPLNRP